MKRPWLNHKRALTAIVIALFVSVMAPSRWTAPLSTGSHYVLATVISPVRSPLHAIASALRRRTDQRVDLGPQAELERNYKEAIVYIQQLESRLRQTQEQIDQLSQLRRRRTLQGLSLLPARVVGSDARGDDRWLTIDRGRRDGVGRNMVVTDGLNLVGRITGAAPKMATVSTINQPGTTLAIRIRPPNADPEARTTLVRAEVAQSGDVLTARCDAQDDVQIGDLAFLDDPTWPIDAQGFWIGKVTDVRPDDDDPMLRRRVVIEPLTDIDSVRRVVVVIRHEGDQPPAQE